MIEKNRLGMTGSFDLEWDHEQRSFAPSAGGSCRSSCRTCRPTGSTAPEGALVALRRQAEAPLVIVAKIKSAIRLVALDEAAVASASSAGQALADARAMIPVARRGRRRSGGRRRASSPSIADWAERYTPLVAVDAATG